MGTAKAVERLGADIEAFLEFAGAERWVECVGCCRVADGFGAAHPCQRPPPGRRDAAALVPRAPADAVVGTGRRLDDRFSPALATGHNGFAAWGVTAGLADTTDLFLENVAPDGRSVRRGRRLRGVRGAPRGDRGQGSLARGRRRAGYPPRPDYQPRAGGRPAGDFDASGLARRQAGTWLLAPARGEVTRGVSSRIRALAPAQPERCLRRRRRSYRLAPRWRCAGAYQRIRHPAQRRPADAATGWRTRPSLTQKCRRASTLQRASWRLPTMRPCPRATERRSSASIGSTGIARAASPKCWPSAMTGTWRRRSASNWTR